MINDRWGKECRHKHGGYWTTEYGAGLPNADHPWEETRGMAFSFGYSRTEPLEDYRTGQELVWMLADLVSRGGNLLLDIGATADGRIPVIMQDRLAEMGQWLKVNGEAIYGTGTRTNTCQWTDGDRPKQGFGQFREKYDVKTTGGAALRPRPGAEAGIFHHPARNALCDSSGMARQDVYVERGAARCHRHRADARCRRDSCASGCRWQHGDRNARDQRRSIALQVRLDAETLRC